MQQLPSQGGVPDAVAPLVLVELADAHHEDEGPWI